MSDPVTNLEIEDVLSSIRRLVSDGDKGRTREAAPAVQPENGPAQTSEKPRESTVDTGLLDRLVLTPALMVSNGTDMANIADKPVADETDDGVWREEEWQDSKTAHDEADKSEADTSSDGPLTLTNMVWDDAEPNANELTVDAPIVKVDRAGLAATIAELEAAIGGRSEEFEPDGSETRLETLEWPVDAARDASVSDDATVSDVEPGMTIADAMPVANDVVADDYGDDDLDALLDTGAAGMDEAALRDLVAQVVREELTGPMGERITRNVRKLVRREIYRILSSQEFD